MRIPFLLLAVASLLGQKQVETSVPEEAERFQVLVIHATQIEGEARVLDPSLEPMRDYLEALPFNAFREIGFHELDVHYGLDDSAKLNDQYTLFVRPSELTEHGEVVFDCRIELSRGDDVLEALRVSGRATRGQGVVFRGLAMAQGEMIVVMNIAKAEESPGGGGASGTPEDGGSGDEGEGQSAQGGEGDGSQDDPEEKKPEAIAMEETEPAERTDQTPLRVRKNSAGEETPMPPDLAAMEGILRALEEQDMQEQKSTRNRRYDVVIPGDWW